MIREATAADTPRLVEMTTRFLLTTRYGDLFKWDPEHIAALVELVLKHGVIVVCEVTTFTWEGNGIAGQNRLVGMIALTALPHPLTGKPFADEHAWWVEPEHRGGTVGPRLMQVAEAWAIKKGCNSVKMVAPEGSTVGIFLERMGYEAVETSFLKQLEPDGPIHRTRDRRPRRGERGSGAA